MFKPVTAYRRLCVQSFCNICFYSQPLRLPHLYLDPSGTYFETCLVRLVLGLLIFMRISIPLTLFDFIHPFIFRDSPGSSLDSTTPIHRPPGPIRNHTHTYLHTPICRVLPLQHTQILPRAIPVSHGFVTPSKLPFLFDSYLCTLLSLPLNFTPLLDALRNILRCQ